ncbi:YqjK-like family protein [Polynucleobacter sp. MWH-Aus1W21]|uniref:YqjK family protein n=1 Tax=Polynucleobacter sp. MWH-Aus1W21 TaxID=1855880 RepID=UPI001BFD0A3E|nr:YqjK-like family protein [Polynucleobacter sp. MWH-Aus1W21]QWD67115.1 YqjK-like family protein [Polynucleobacter sp. MWH-Aus1W21]
MNDKLKALEGRQRELTLQASKERIAFAEHFESLEKPLSWVDKGMDAVHFIKSNPFLWTSAFAALAHYKPKIASKVLAMGWGAMKLVKSAKKLI